jgi:hypothetical protein
LPPAAGLVLVPVASPLSVILSFCVRSTIALPVVVYKRPSELFMLNSPSDKFAVTGTFPAVLALFNNIVFGIF